MGNKIIFSIIFSSFLTFTQLAAQETKEIGVSYQLGCDYDSLPRKALCLFKDPIFSSEDCSIEKILFSEISKIHKKIYFDNYILASFVLRIDEQGLARDLKLLSVSQIFRHDFMIIYPSILKRISNWLPAFDIYSGEAVLYDLHIEIDSNKEHYTLKIINDYFEELLSVKLEF
jgi:hypothetical protein